MGARGNSGVILSQILRGLAKGMEMKERFSAFDFAQALRHASDTAYKSISEPVEGTILTVIREASEMAMQKARLGADLKQTLTVVASQAKRTVVRTPEMLSILKEAGVVDAGGKGLFYIFQGMKNYISRKMAQVEGYTRSRGKTMLIPSSGVYGFDVQFLIEGINLPLNEIRSRVGSMGESVLVVGEKNLIRVHIHTKDPQRVVDYCATKGILKDIVQENLDNQVKAFNKRKYTSGTTTTKSPDSGSRPKSIQPRNARLNNLAAST
jgi:dihydroxyacetone kinase-like predicted kinase